MIRSRSVRIFRKGSDTGDRGNDFPAKFLLDHSRLKRVFVEKIHKDNHWKVVERMGQNRTLKAKHLVVTFPVPQVIELFDRSDLTLDPLTMGVCVPFATPDASPCSAYSPDLPTWITGNGDSSGFRGRLGIRQSSQGSRKNPPVLFTRLTTFPRNTGILRTKNEVRCLRKSPRKLWNRGYAMELS